MLGRIARLDTRRTAVVLAISIVVMAAMGIWSILFAPDDPWFGLDSDSVEVELAPLLLQPVKEVNLKRVRGTY